MQPDQQVLPHLSFSASFFASPMHCQLAVHKDKAACSLVCLSRRQLLGKALEQVVLEVFESVLQQAALLRRGREAQGKQLRQQDQQAQQVLHPVLLAGQQAAL